MLKLAIILVVGVIARLAYGDDPERIIGGSPAVRGQFKHQISLQYRYETLYGYTYRHTCGGSIISSKHVLTAAHCVENVKSPSEMVVVTGTITSNWNTSVEDGEYHDIKCINIHENYTGLGSDGWKNDVALITLVKAIVFNDLQAPIPLATQDWALTRQSANNLLRGEISGWGKTSVDSSIASPILLWAGVNVLSQDKCLAAYPKTGSDSAFTNPTHICTLERRGVGACSGDSGGPLVINGQLCGVASWVTYCALGAPDVYTNVYYFKKFINESIAVCS